MTSKDVIFILAGLLMACEGAGAPETDQGPDDDAPSLVELRPQSSALTTATLDVKGFGEDVHKTLKDSVTGYAMQLRKDGAPVYTLLWNWARTPVDGGKGWTLDTRMHIASVSKLITGIAMTRLLDTKKISYDAKISGYLPAYWKKGPNIGKITFRQLMTHKSGFNTGLDASDYAFMKARVAEGVTSVGTKHYENMNFGLCRILIAILNGNISKNQVFATNNDQQWDATTISAYKAYVQVRVLLPANVVGAGFAPEAGGALAYDFPDDGAAGSNSGDLASMSGGAGWRLSVNELLRVMDAFRRKGTIMTSAKAQAMLDNMFGIDQVLSTTAGTLYNKNGRWTWNGGTEQAVAYFLPGGMELVVFVNSPIGTQAASLVGTITTLYQNHLQ